MAWELRKTWQTQSKHLYLISLETKGGEIRDTKALNLSRNIVAFQVLARLQNTRPVNLHTIE